MSNRVGKLIAVIGYLVVGILALLLFVCLMGIHGDGWVRPTIRVQVNGPDGSPIEEAAVIFFDREGQRAAWLHSREGSLSTEDWFPERATGATNGHGEAEIQGSFGAAFYLYHTYLGGRGILRVEKPGYLPTEVVIDSGERREEILDELVGLDVTLKWAEGSEVDEL